MINVLFLCTGNSARSILAETILNSLGDGRYRAYSAGSHPTGVVNPYVVAILKALGYDDVATARSKSWDEFTASPVFDLVVTLCDEAADETCPIWQGTPLQVHWGLPDPAAQTDEAAERGAFMDAYEQVHQFIVALIDVPLTGHDAVSLRQAITSRLDPDS